MPNSPNAKKALRKSLKRRDRNRAQRTSLRTAVKNVRKSAQAHEEEKARNAFQAAVSKLDCAADKNLIHKNKAARTKSRLSELLKRTFETEKATA